VLLAAALAAAELHEADDDDQDRPHEPYKACCKDVEALEQEPETDKDERDRYHLVVRALATLIHIVHVC
jgi:hypothetical protein